MSKHQAKPQTPNASAAAASAKSEPIVILDAHDGTPLIIVPSKAGATPAAPQPSGADGPPRPQEK